MTDFDIAEEKERKKKRKALFAFAVRATVLRPRGGNGLSANPSEIIKDDSFVRRLAAAFSGNGTRRDPD